MCKFLKVFAVIILIAGIFALGCIMADNKQLQQSIRSFVEAPMMTIQINESWSEHLSDFYQRMLDANGIVSRLWTNANDIKVFIIDLIGKNISYLQNNVLLIQ